MNIRLTISALLIAGAGLAGASAARIVITPAEGEARYAALTTSTKVEFAADGVKVVNGTESALIPWAELQKLSFDSESGVAGVAAEGTLRLRENPVGDLLEVIGFEGESAQLTITSMNGQTIARIAEWHGEELEVSALTPGIYILTIEKQAIKFIKK